MCNVLNSGDVNNDTFADVVIGAPYAVNTNGVITGASYVLFGNSTDYLTSIELVSLPANGGFVTYGASTQDAFGVSVSGAGDVNGDGFDDVIVGALRMNDLFSGAAYVVYGAAQLISANKAPVLLMSGAAHSWFGYSVSRAGKRYFIVFICRV